MNDAFRVGNGPNSETTNTVRSKVPAATLGFWVLKLIATTVGEIGGNLLSMNLGLGYFAATVLLFAVFATFTAFQVSARTFHPGLYWATIVASTTAGTTLADFADRSLGIGYTGGSLLLFALVITSLIAWKRDAGRLSSDVIVSRRIELHYWLTITFSQTLGTALGDWFADTAGLGYGGSTIVFSIALAVIAGLFLIVGLPCSLIWMAFGVALKRLLDRPQALKVFNITMAVLLVASLYPLVQDLPAF